MSYVVPTDPAAAAYAGYPPPAAPAAPVAPAAAAPAGYPPYADPYAAAYPGAAAPAQPYYPPAPAPGAPPPAAAYPYPEAYPPAPAAGYGPPPGAPPHGYGGPPPQGYGGPPGRGPPGRGPPPGGRGRGGPRGRGGGGRGMKQAGPQGDLCIHFQRKTGCGNGNNCPWVHMTLQERLGRNDCIFKQIKGVCARPECKWCGRAPAGDQAGGLGRAIGERVPTGSPSMPIGQPMPGYGA